MVQPLVFEEIGKRFGQTIALSSLSLSIEPGEIVGFLGPNGAGKTTAIDMAMGLLRATSGRGEIFGVAFEQARKQHAKVGHVPDAPVFFPGSALDAVLFAGRLNGRGGKDLRLHAQELLRRFELPAHGRDVRRFSRGMQQRLSLVQALVTRPRLLILDEPLSALDPGGVALVRSELNHARAEGAAVLLSSHQLEHVEALCDRAAFLHRGSLLKVGSMGELLENKSMVSVTLHGLSDQRPFLLKWQNALVGRSPGSGDHRYQLPAEQLRPFVEEAWCCGAELVRVEREQRTLIELFAELTRDHKQERSS